MPAWIEFRNTLEALGIYAPIVPPVKVIHMRCAG